MDMLPLMMGVMAGQNGYQNEVLDEQNRLLAEQNRLAALQVWWLQWRDPIQQKLLIDWYLGATQEQVDEWNASIWYSLPRECYDYLIAIVTPYIGSQDTQ